MNARRASGSNIDAVALVTMLLYALRDDAATASMRCSLLHTMIATPRRFCHAAAIDFAAASYADISVILIAIYGCHAVCAATLLRERLRWRLRYFSP